MSRLKRLIQEIHQRSIWQVLAIYTGGSWALLGNVDLVTARFGFPDWMFPASLILTSAGFVGVLTIKIWPRVWRPDLVSPARTAAKSGLLYLLGAFLILENLDQLIGHGYAPELAYVLVLTLFPVTGILVVFSAKRSPALWTTINRAVGVGLLWMFVFGMFFFSLWDQSLPWLMLYLILLAAGLAMIWFWFGHKKTH